VLATLERSSSPSYKADLAKRYGIVTKAQVYGVPIATLRKLAKSLGPDHDLAEQLWASGVHDARMLATMVDDPAQVTPSQMERWLQSFDNWALVDTACFHYWDRTPHAHRQIAKWAKAKDELVKRAAFALLACCAVHRQGTEEQLLHGLDLIKRHAGDERNFVKKGVAWALRAIGGSKNRTLRAGARAVAKELGGSEDPTERWIGKDALRAFAKG
jgi:3-methyladenine DNA glycosylase AlkD